MPLTELMNYFNDQLQTQSHTEFLPKIGFFKSNNAYMARFGNLILGSKFHQIHYTDEDELFAHESELLVRSAAGNPLNIDNIFNSLDSTGQIIQLDRLVRTLHSLNYLQQIDMQKNEGSKGLLALPVQPRHIISVVDDHGKAFENILSDCGLGPERVLLHTRLVDDATLKHFHKALSNYRQRDYKIGISLMQPQDLNLLEKFDFEPDVIFVKDFIFQGATKSRALDLLPYYNSSLIIVSAQTPLEPIDAIFQGSLVNYEALSGHETISIR
ncbi:MAG: hypothetical protein V4732_16205 [Pseudomonadota bacterium]